MPIINPVSSKNSRFRFSTALLPKCIPPPGTLQKLLILDILCLISKILLSSINTPFTRTLSLSPNLSVISFSMDCIRVDSPLMSKYSQATPKTSVLLKRNFPHDPTPGQEYFFQQMDVFLGYELNERPTFLLKGYAGTGKTSVVSALVKS